MKNRKLMCIFVIVILVFIFICISSYFNSLSSSNSSSLSKYDLLKYEKYIKNNKYYENAKIATLDIYYEALCPDSKNFIINQLDLLIDDNVNTKNKFEKHRDQNNGYDLNNSLLATSKDTYLQINLIPFGKANYQRVDEKWKFTCQHGPDECFANQIHNCVIFHTSNNVLEYFPFIKCAMNYLGNSKEEIIAESRKCFTKTSSGTYSFEQILDCANGIKGTELLYEAGVKTHALKNPILNYIPWIVLNNMHDERMQNEAEFDILKFLNFLFK